MWPGMASYLGFVKPWNQKATGPSLNLVTFCARLCVWIFLNTSSCKTLIFLVCSRLLLPPSPRGSTSSDVLAQILARWKINNNLTTCYCACTRVVTAASSQSSAGEVWLSLAACLLSALCVYSEWNGKWRICLPACCALLRSALCTDCLCKWRERSPEAWKGESHSALHWECLWERWGGCLHREEVSQAVVDEGESKAGEQFSAPESFIIELLQHQPTSLD